MNLVDQSYAVSGLDPHPPVYQVLLCCLLTRENDSWFQGLEGDHGLFSGGGGVSYAHCAWDEGPSGHVCEPYLGELRSTYSEHSSELLLITSGASILCIRLCILCPTPCFKSCCSGAMLEPMLCQESPRRKDKAVPGQLSMGNYCTEVYAMAQTTVISKMHAAAAIIAPRIEWLKLAVNEAHCPGSRKHGRHSSEITSLL